MCLLTSVGVLLDITRERLGRLQGDERLGLGERLVLPPCDDDSRDVLSDQ